jgi:predicted Zn-dependent protease
MALVEEVLNVGAARKLECSGLLSHRTKSHAVGNKKRLFAYHQDTRVSLGTTFRTGDGKGSGKAGMHSHRLAGIDAQALALSAADVAQRSREPTALDPGRTTVVLTAQAVADLLGFLLWSMGARAADEGRSFFSAKDGGNRVGERLFDPAMSLYSDPAASNHPSSPFDSSGRPLAKTTWIEQGVLKNLTYSPYWASKKGKKPVGRPGSLFLVHAGKAPADSIDALVGGVKRGVLISRFWYNRMVDRQSILATGLTRDGTFLIEDGKVSRAVNNFRYNESPIALLTRAIAVGKPERAGLSSSVRVVPPMTVAEFNLASVSDAV